MQAPCSPPGTPDPLCEAAEQLARGDWPAAHVIVQAHASLPHAAWAHGIVHLLEGDLDNARYWYERAGRAFPRDPAVGPELEALQRALAARGPFLDRR